MLRNQIKVLVAEELNKLLERKRVTSQILFHGTSTKFLPGILSHGLSPDPREKTWSDDPAASSIQPSRVSLKGSYWTSSIMLAMQAAGNSKDKFGGKRVIVIAQIIPQSAYADEDSVRSPVIRAASQAIADTIGGYPSDERLWFYKGAFDAEPELLNQAIEIFGNVLHKRLTKNEKMPIDKNTMKIAFIAYIDRILAHTKGYKDIWNYVDGLERFGASEKAKEIAETKSLPKISSAIAERNFLDALDKISKRYKESALETDQVVHSLRMPNEVGFSGRNKILSIVVLPDYGEEAHIIKTVFGAPNSNFIEQYKKAWSKNFILLDKNGQIVYKPTS